jgi:hypothetical protein
MTTLFSDRIADWRVVVVRFPNFATPFVSAVKWEPDFRLQQTLMDGASPAKLRVWIEGLGA